MTTNEVSILIQTQSLNQTLTRCLAKTTTICLKGNTSYIYDNFICEIKHIILSCIIISEHTRPSLPICILKSKLKVWTPTVTLTLVVRNWDLFATHHTSMVISYMKEKIKSFHAYRSFRADRTTTFYIYIT
jgi:hypothetical protein